MAAESNLQMVKLKTMALLLAFLFLPDLSLVVTFLTISMSSQARTKLSGVIIYCPFSLHLCFNIACMALINGKFSWLNKLIIGLSKELILAQLKRHLSWGICIYIYLFKFTWPVHTVYSWRANPMKITKLIHWKRRSTAARHEVRGKKRAPITQISKDLH